MLDKSFIQDLWDKSGNNTTWTNNNNGTFTGKDNETNNDSNSQNTTGGGEGKGDPPNKYKKYFAQKYEESKHLDKSLNLQSSATEAAIPFALTASAVDGPIPVGEVVGAVAIAGAATYDLTQKVYVTYTLRNSTGQVYAGRASGYGSPYAVMMNRFASHHMRFFGYGNPTLDVAAQGITAYPAIRGREQQLIDFFGGVGSPTCGNRINAIWQYNPAKPAMMEASNIMFGPLK